MATLKFFPIGNADTSLIHLNDERLILVDYCNRPLEEGDKRVDLEGEIRNYLERQNSNEFDLVAFTHADDDHVHGAEEFFWFRSASKYQSSDRVKIKTLAIPACFFLEPGLTGSARVIHDEARFRLKEGKGVLIFGDPEILNDWMKKEGIPPEVAAKCIVHAGTCLPGFDRNNGQAEFFIHSPFSFKMENEDAPRNNNCLIMHVTFYEGEKEMRLMLGGDGCWEDWINIIYLTKKAGNEIRLNWDVFHVSHHCSYLALSDIKGKHKTTPKPQVDELFNLAGDNCILISPSDPIPSVDTDQPPHRQAAAYYQEIAEKFGNKENFMVTMQWPSISSPKPITIKTTPFGFQRQINPTILGGAASVVERQSPRLG